MVKTIQLTSFKYKYDPIGGRILDPGDYKNYPVYTTAVHLNGTTPPLSKVSGKQSQKNRNTLGLLQLCVPVLNFALAGKNGKYLRMILNMSQVDFENIVYCNQYYDLDDDELVSHSHIRNHRYIIGTNYIYKLIEDFNIEEEILQLLSILVHKCCIRDMPEDFIDLVVHDDKADTDLRLVKDYAINKECRDYLIDDFEETKDKLLQKELSSSISRLTVLLNLPSDKSSLFAMIAPFMLVLPYDYRRGTGTGERHPSSMTLMYQRVIEENASLQSYSSMSDKLSNAFKDGYKKLENAVNAVYYNKEYFSTRGTKDDMKSLLESLSGKFGIIREQCLGKRQDYSGRSVVTISPYLSLVSVNLPKDMILSMFEYHALPELVRRLNVADTSSDLYGLTILDLHGNDIKKSQRLQEEMFDIITKPYPPYTNSLLDRIPVYMGRQPTLHKHSYQSFYVGVSDTNSIQVNPLVCPGYNMDFDGDQAYVNIPIHSQAIQEVAQLMSTPQTVYLTKTGSSTIEPRQDMIYGLYMCTRNTNTGHANAVQAKVTTLKEAYDALCKNKYAVWDKVSINGANMTIGDAAFMYCFAEGDISPRNSNGEMCVKEVTSKNIGDYVEYILNDQAHRPRYSLTDYSNVPGTFVGTINHLVKLGFDVAKYYPPNVSMVDTEQKVGDIDIGNGETLSYEDCLIQLRDMTQEADFYYLTGMDTATSYKEFFSESVSKIKKCIELGINKSLSDTNGYKLMSVSGARGDKDNLSQIFKYKGQIQKDSTHSFDAVIEKGYREQLGPMDFFVNAYGGRQGQIDKSLKTADTGYFSRSLWHATQGYSITCEDCGDSEGIELSYDFFTTHFPDEDPIDLFTDWLTDHQIIGKSDISGRVVDVHPHLVTKSEAEMLASDRSAVYRIRSPLTCKKPCCKVCYGIDPSTHLQPVIGTNVGINAAQSIGEISTQATMKTFQKGGNSGTSAVASAFDRAVQFLSLQDIDFTKNGYDPIAWDSGTIIKEKGVIPGTYKIKIRSSETGKLSKKTAVVRQTTNLLDTVTKGCGISKVRGDYNMLELINVMGVDFAQKYLIAKLRAIYSPVKKLKFVHFEILIASLARYLILYSDRDRTAYQPDGRVTLRELKAGERVTAQELYCGSLKGTKYVKQLISYKNILVCSTDMLDSIQKEKVGQGLARSALLHMDDTLNKPINRMLVAKGPLTGSSVDGYLEEFYRR